MLGLPSRTVVLGSGIFFFLVALLAPAVVLTKFQTLEFVYVWAFAIAIVGLNLLTGYCGQISLGNSAFMAIGGYATALLAVDRGWSPLATIPVAAAVAAAGGILVGIPALKLRGLYLGLATFALALSAPSVIRHFDTFTGGSQGIYIRGAGKDPFGLVDGGALTSEQWLYYLSLVLFVLLFLFIRALLKSDVGRAFRSIRDRETVAVANGVSLTYYKTLAFAISALFAGVGGSLDVMATSYIAPDSFDVNVALALLVGAAVGGLGTQAGPIVGAIFTVWAPNYTQKIFHGSPGIVYGALLILIMYVMPDGSVGGFFRLLNLRSRLRRRATTPPGGLAKAAVDVATESKHR